MNYTTTNVSFHGGDLFEHSVWVAMTVKQWFREHNKWTDGLTYNDQRCAVFAALIHDVGKGGDRKFTFDKKPNHESIGQEYILGLGKYELASGGYYDFNALFADLGFSEDDQRFISVLVAAHSNFGWAMADRFKNKNTIPNVYDNYTSKLFGFMRIAKYNKPFDDRMLRMIMLISAADVRGALPYDCCRTLTIQSFRVSSVPLICHTEAKDNFNIYSYPEEGLQLRNDLLKWYSISKHLKHKHDLKELPPLTPPETRRGTKYHSLRGCQIHGPVGG